MSAASGRLGIPFVVAAASGTGKTTVCRQLVETNREIEGRPLEFSVSHTTRPRRSQEVKGVDYHFETKAGFQRLVDEGAFLEWATYNEHRYGTSWSSIDGPLKNGIDLLLEIEVQGAGQVRERRDDARFVFLLPPSIEALAERLRSRGTDTQEQIERRLQHFAGQTLVRPGGDSQAVLFWHGWERIDALVRWAQRRHLGDWRTGRHPLQAIAR